MDKKLGLLVVVLILVIAGFYFMNPNKTMDKSKINTNLTLNGQTSPTPFSSPSLEPSVNPVSSPTTFPDGLQIQDEKLGNGKEVKSGDTISINYLGTLQNGKKFDSSYDRGQPFQTQIGVGQVIKGWDEGVVGMKVGGKRKLIIPPSLGYGSRDMGTIPPSSTLIFEVELMAIR